MTEVTIREESWVRRLTTAKNRAQHEIVAFGKLLTQCKQSVVHGSWGRVLSELGMSEDVALRLMTIAAHPVLANPAHERDLPRAVNTLAVLGRLSAAEIEACIADGRIHAGMKRSEAEALVPKKTSGAGPAPRSETGGGVDPTRPAPQDRKDPTADVAAAQAHPDVGWDEAPKPATPEDRSDREAEMRVERAHGSSEVLEGSSVAAAAGEPEERLPDPSISSAEAPTREDGDAPASVSTSAVSAPVAAAGSASDPLVAGKGGGPQPPRPAPHPNGSKKEQERYAERYEAGELIHNSVLFIADALEVDGWKSVGVYLAKHPDCAQRLHAAAHRVAEAIGQIEAMAIT